VLLFFEGPRGVYTLFSDRKRRNKIVALKRGGSVLDPMLHMSEGREKSLDLRRSFMISE
jgi:hypothetical protein